MKYKGQSWDLGLGDTHENLELLSETLNLRWAWMGGLFPILD